VTRGEVEENGNDGRAVINCYNLGEVGERCLLLLPALESSLLFSLRMDAAKTEKKS
jgi:hypothetical protein